MGAIIVDVCAVRSDMCNAREEVVRARAPIPASLAHQALALFIQTTTSPHASRTMAPSEFSLRLQKGVGGGFVAPKPEEIITITKPADQANLFIASENPQSGASSASADGPKILPFDNDHDDAKLIDELHAILSSIPQPPPGSADVYELDTSIAWGSKDLMWQNISNEGCGGFVPEDGPSKEDKTKFKRAVEIIKHLVSEKH